MYATCPARCLSSRYRRRICHTAPQRPQSSGTENYQGFDTSSSVAAGEVPSDKECFLAEPRVLVRQEQPSLTTTAVVGTTAVNGRLRSRAYWPPPSTAAASAGRPWLAGWLAGWLLAGRLAGRLAGWLAGRLAGCCLLTGEHKPQRWQLVAGGCQLCVACDGQQKDLRTLGSYML